MPDWFWYGVVFGYGAVVGSFLNVLIYRMPLGMSVVSPPSQCPRCGQRLGFWDNIPLLSFLTLGGRCRYCRTPISWRYFCVELLTGALWVALFGRLGGETGVSWVNYVAHALFASVLVAAIFIDLDHFLIPDELNWAGLGIGVARDVVCLGLAWQAGPPLWGALKAQFLVAGWVPRSIVGALAYGGLLFLVSLFAFVYYARVPGETLAHAVRRFFVYDEEADLAEPEPSVSTSHPTNTSEREEAAENAPEEEEEEGEPARLRLSPAFLIGVSALLLAPVLKLWAVLVFLVLSGAFVLLSQRSGNSWRAPLFLFFAADDQSPPADMPPSVPGDRDDADTLSPELLAAEANQFAREAETGQHGGMGLGDVKLALAIGALLGPGQALLSLFFATAFGSIVGIGLAAVHGKGLRIGIPFGPFMALGAFVCMLYGPALVQWYQQTTGLR